MGKIFISYRRQDSADMTARVYDRLRASFPDHEVFMDIDAIPPGVDFRDHIRQEIRQCDVVLAVVGQEWLSAADDDGRRLDHPGDYVRLEIRAALEARMPVIPVLIHGASAPKEDFLPEDIREFAYRNALEIRSGGSFDADIGRLFDALRKHLNDDQPSGAMRGELVILPLGIILSVVGGFLIIGACMYAFGYGAMAPATSAAELRDGFLGLALFGVITNGCGPLLIVLGKWWCCQRAEQRSRLDRLRFGLPAAPPKSHKSILSLGCGVSSLGWSLISALPGIVWGVWALWDVARQPARLRGRRLAWIGIVCGCIGAFATVGFWSRAIYVYNSQRQIDRGLELLEQHRFKEASDAFRTVIERHPWLPMHIAFKHRGVANFNLGDPQSAIDDLTRYLESPVGSATQGLFRRHAVEARFYRSKAHAARGEDALAKADLNHAHTMDSHRTAELEIQFREGP